MSYFETEKFFGSEKSLPKINHGDFCEDPQDIVDITMFDSHDSETQLTKHLYSLEQIYSEHIIVNKNKPDSRVCNEIMFSCIQLFSDQMSMVIIYSMIVDFFDFNNTHFYDSLNAHFKNQLKHALSKRISLDTYERNKRCEETKYGGAYTPSFRDALKNKI